MDLETINAMTTVGQNFLLLEHWLMIAESPGFCRGEFVKVCSRYCRMCIIS